MGVPVGNSQQSAKKVQATRVKTQFIKYYYNTLFNTANK